MLGSVYKQGSERVKVLSAIRNGYKCMKWFNGTANEITLTKDQINQLEYICTP